jgi:hypothetical protein
MQADLPDGQVWRVAPGTMLFRDWGSEFAVFHDATASTHLLDADAAALLLKLHELGQEIEVGDLGRMTFESQLSDDELPILSEALRRMAQIGLVCTEVR